MYNASSMPQLPQMCAARRGKVKYERGAGKKRIGAGGVNAGLSPCPIGGKKGFD